ncbi:MAG TPA: DNA-binding protein [Nitrososphaeraceae archaeon]|jgi:DNA-binding TFAR19-related protein (PDSD5 family)
MERDEDPDLAIIKARKMKELREQVAYFDKLREKKTEPQGPRQKSDKEILLSLLYDRADEVLRHADAQFPEQTRILVSRIAQLIRAGEITSPISGGELLALFRYAGLRVRINTKIKIEDHGKFISFSEKLKQENP